MNHYRPELTIWFYQSQISCNFSNTLNIFYLYNSYLCIGHYGDLLITQSTVVLTETLIMALSVLKSILLSQGQSIYHDNGLCISNNYFYFIEGNKTKDLLPCWFTLTTARSSLRFKKGMQL